MKNKLLNLVEDTQLKNNLPTFNVGNILELYLWVLDGNKKRIQKFVGIVIAKKNKGLNSSFTIRKISYGEGVERVFQTHSPIINKIIIKNKLKIKKAKLYHLRNLSPKQIKKIQTIKI